MAEHGLERAIDLLCARDDRYAPDAYLFIRDGLDYTLSMTDGEHATPRHVTGRELCDGLRLHAIEQFGPLARTVLAYWGITSTQDFGNLVFNLVEAGLLGKNDDDSPDDFRHLYTFNDAFSKPFQAHTPWFPHEDHTP